MFLASFVVIPVTAAIAERAVVVRRRPRFKLPDAIILATAESNDRLLVTRDTWVFSEDDLRVRIPYSI